MDPSAILFSLLVGAGLFIAVSAFGVNTKTGFTKLTQDEYGTIRAENIFKPGEEEGNVFLALLADISKRIRPEKGNLQELLVRSGYAFKTVPEYHYKRIYFSLLGAFVFIMLANSFQFPSSIYPFVGIVGAVFGFFRPDNIINNKIKSRSKQMQREMGFALDKITLILQAGGTVPEALASVSNMGVFGCASGQIASAISMQLPVEQSIENVKSQLPRVEQFDEFCVLVMESIKRGDSLKKPFEDMGKQMRSNLNNELLAEGGRAKVKIVLLTSSLMILGVMVAVGAKLLLQISY